jgi:hypothetical protein
LTAFNGFPPLITPDAFPCLMTSSAKPATGAFYPGTDVDDTIEALFAEQNFHRPALYWFLIFLLGGFLAALPWIKVDLTIRARAVVVPAAPSFDAEGTGRGAPAPDGIALEAFLPEREVKFLRVGQSTTLQYEAYPYTEWGSGSGRLTEVASEPVMLGQRALYKVAVHSDVDHLRLNDGRIGRISAGMSATLRCLVNRKSLLQLIYQRSEDLFGL